MPELDGRAVIGTWDEYRKCYLPDDYWRDLALNDPARYAREKMQEALEWVLGQCTSSEREWHPHLVHLCPEHSL